MDPILIFDLAIRVLREALLEIERRVKSGKIAVQAQQAQLRKIDAIRAGDYSGVEWKIEPDPAATVIPPSDTPPMPGPHTAATPKAP